MSVKRKLSVVRSVVVPAVAGLGLREAAVRYAEAGLWVGPLRIGKHPGSLLGKKWQDKTSNDPAVVSGWFDGLGREDWYRKTAEITGVFLHCGPSGVLVFDADHPENMPQLLRAAINRDHPIQQFTRIDQTRIHYLYATNGQEHGNRKGALGGGEEWGQVRGGNGIIVLQPSAHPKAAEGGIYRWDTSGVLPVLPAELSDALDGEVEGETGDFGGAPGTDFEAVQDLARFRVNIELAGIPYRRTVDVGYVGGVLYRARCPVHTQDGKAHSDTSLQFGLKKDSGQFVWHCHAECSQEAVAKSIGFALQPTIKTTVGDKVKVKRFGLNDKGSGSRLNTAHGHELRFIERALWRQYSEGHWQKIGPEEVMTFARGLTDKGGYMDQERKPIKNALIKARRDGNVKLTARLKDELDTFDSYRWGLTSDRALRAIVNQAKSAGLLTPASVFDAPETDGLLNLANGTFDLRTGELRPAAALDFITMQAPTLFDPLATDPRWEAFLSAYDPKLVKILRRLLYGSLFGGTDEKFLVGLVGETDSGKTTLANAVRGALGVYAASFDSTKLMRGGQGASSMIANTAGKRLVFISEPEADARMLAGLVKLLTGGETVSARALYAQDSDHRLLFTPWLGMNAVPQLPYEDSALWHRVILLPMARRKMPANHWLSEFARDPAIHQAVLTWILRGRLAWERKGSAVTWSPARALMAQTREEANPLADWMAECLNFAPGLWLSVKQRNDSYTDWCDANGERPVSGQVRNKLLEPLVGRQRVKKENNLPTRGWDNVGIRRFS